MSSRLTELDWDWASLNSLFKFWDRLFDYLNKNKKWRNNFFIVVRKEIRKVKGKERTYEEIYIIKFIRKEEEEKENNKN